MASCPRTIGLLKHHPDAALAPLSDVSAKFPLVINVWIGGNYNQRRSEAVATLARYTLCACVEVLDNACSILKTIDIPKTSRPLPPPERDWYRALHVTHALPRTHAISSCEEVDLSYHTYSYLFESDHVWWPDQSTTPVCMYRREKAESKSCCASNWPSIRTDFNARVR